MNYRTFKSPEMFHPNHFVSLLKTFETKKKKFIYYHASYKNMNVQFPTDTTSVVSSGVCFTL